MKCMRLLTHFGLPQASRAAQYERTCRVPYSTVLRCAVSSGLFEFACRSSRPPQAASWRRRALTSRHSSSQTSSCRHAGHTEEPPFARFGLMRLPVLGFQYSHALAFAGKHVHRRQTL